MIIDTHVHVGGEKIGFDMSEEKVLAAMEKYKIDFMIVSNGDCVEVDHEQKLIPAEYQVSQEEALKRCISFARKHPGKIGVGVWVKPLTETVTEELEKLIAENRDILCLPPTSPLSFPLAPVLQYPFAPNQKIRLTTLTETLHTSYSPDGLPDHNNQTFLQ